MENSQKNVLLDTRINRARESARLKMGMFTELEERFATYIRHHMLCMQEEEFFWDDFIDLADHEIENNSN